MLNNKTLVMRVFPYGGVVPYKSLEEYFNSNDKKPATIIRVRRLSFSNTEEICILDESPYIDFSLIDRYLVFSMFGSEVHSYSSVDDYEMLGSVIL